MEEVFDVFNPVKYSLEENEFLLKHLGEPYSVAAKSFNPQINPNPARNKEGTVIDRNPTIYPDGVIPASVKPIIDRVYELIDLEKRGEQWVGVGKVKERIQVYLDQQKRWMSDKKRFPRAPRFPSMSSFDAKGKPHRGGPGADSGVVSTYFDAKGNRHPFELDLIGNRETGGWTPEWAEKVPEEREVIPESATRGLTHDVGNHRLECPICKHTESYKVDSASSYNAARGRISKHLRNETKEQELHRELYTNEFGS